MNSSKILNLILALERFGLKKIAKNIIIKLGSFSVAPFDKNIHSEQILELDEEVFGDRDPNIFIDAQGFVAEDNHVMVGYILFQHLGNNIHIRSLGVKNDAQGRGLGSDLIEKVLIYADNLDLPCSLCIDPNFHKDSGAPDKLRRLYSKYGFFYTGENNRIGNEIWKRKSKKDQQQ